MEAMIRVENLKFLDIISYPDMQIEQGQITVLQGESGCGKSTLLKLLNQTQTQSEGKIYYRGTDLDALDTIQLRRELILVNQSLFLFPGTIRENFRMFYERREQIMPSDEELLNFLRICQVPFSLEDLSDTMSGGEKQRVFHAIALSFRPKVLMLDEPTSALDHETAFRFMEQIKEYCKKQEISILMISHDKSLTETFADKMIWLKKGVS